MATPPVYISRKWAFLSFSFWTVFV